MGRWIVRGIALVAAGWLGSLTARAALPSVPPPPAPETLFSAEHRLDLAHVPEPWTHLIQALQSKGNISATFTENRYLPFKKIPVVFTGEIRLSAEHGLSLHYLTPEDRMMIVDTKGVLLRDGAGHARELPADPRANAATTALLHVMRFDLAALEPHFEIYVQGDARVWHFGFHPKDEAVAHALSRLTVSGENEEVRRIVMRKSALQSIEILIGEVHTGVTFTPDELKQFFR